MDNRTAFATGVTGQDGAYLSAHLLEKGYRVFGLVQRSTRYAFANLDFLGVTGEIEYIEGNMDDEGIAHQCHPVGASQRDIQPGSPSSAPAGIRRDSPPKSTRWVL